MVPSHDNISPNPLSTILLLPSSFEVGSCSASAGVGVSSRPHGDLEFGGLEFVQRDSFMVHDLLEQ